VVFKNKTKQIFAENYKNLAENDIYIYLIVFYIIMNKTELYEYKIKSYKSEFQIYGGGEI
jgi:hypothetical protein